jgi:hypothetical protein
VNISDEQLRKLLVGTWKMDCPCGNSHFVTLDKDFTYKTRHDAKNGPVSDRIISWFQNDTTGIWEVQPAFVDGSSRKIVFIAREIKGGLCGNVESVLPPLKVLTYVALFLAPSQKLWIFDFDDDNAFTAAWGEKHKGKMIRL